MRIIFRTSLLLMMLSAAVPLAAGQLRRVTTTPPDSTRIQSNPQPDPTPARGNRRIDTPSGAITEVDPDPIPRNAVRIYVRYRKSLGYRLIGGGGLLGKPGPYSCDAFNVDANPYAGLGRRPSGSDTPVRGITNPNTMRTEGNYYVCGFTVEYLPQNQPITVTASVVNDSRILKGPWLGEGRPRPPYGSERSIFNGVQTVKLTNRNPSEIATFEMVYAPVLTPPR